MAALTESTLRMLANTGAYPESANYPNDGNGGDHDSLGLFQMRPQSGWGTVAELMDPTYQARAFFGGPTGPNYPSAARAARHPRLAADGPRRSRPSGRGVAYPTATATTRPSPKPSSTALTGASRRPARPARWYPAVPSSRVVFPLPEGTWVLTSPVRDAHAPDHRRTEASTPAPTSPPRRHPDPRRRGRHRDRRGVLRRVRRPHRHRAHHRRPDRRDRLRAHVAARHPRPSRATG
jgi:hypothetical protein